MRTTWDPGRGEGVRVDSDAVWRFDTGGMEFVQKRGEMPALEAACEPEWRRDDLDTLLEELSVLDISDAAICLFGLPMDRDHLLTWPVVNLWPEASHATLADAILSVCIGGGSSTECRTIDRVGWLEDVRLTAERSSRDDEASVVVVTISGVVSPVSALRELQWRQDRWRNMLSTLPIPTWQVDARPAWKILARLTENGVDDLAAYLQDHPALIDHLGKVIHATQVNDAAVELYGAADASELLGPVEYFFDAAPGSHLRLMTAHSRGLPAFLEEMQIRTRDGRVQDVLFMVMFPGPKHRLESTVVLMVDNTLRVATETKLRRLEADFARAARISTLGELTASIAHEVKQPIAAILTNAETSLRWLRKDPPNLAKVEQLTDRIVASARNAGDIINRIQDMARQRSPSRRAVSLNEVALQAATFVRSDIEDSGIILSTDLTSALGLVLGDRIQLQQVLVNLLVNGAQALRSGGARGRRLSISTYPVGHGKVRIAVRDTGPGIPPEDFERVFDGFFSTKEEGLGIGLAICQSIVVAHGGSITAANGAGGGAVFEVTLPTGDHELDEEAAEREASSSRAAWKSGQDHDPA